MLGLRPNNQAQSHRDGERFERSGWSVEVQPLPRFAGHHLLHVVADGADVPVGDEMLASAQRLEGLLGKGPKIDAINSIRGVVDRSSFAGFLANTDLISC